MSTRMLGVLPALLLSSIAAASGTYDVTIKGYITHHFNSPIEDMTVEFWEDDAIDDDFLGSTLTEYLGSFEWSRDGITDQDGATDPEIYLVVKLSGRKFVLSMEDIVNVHGTPFTAQVTGKLHPEDHIQPGGRSVIDVGVLELEDHSTELLYASAVYQAVERILSELRSYPYRVGVYLDLENALITPPLCLNDQTHVYYLCVVHLDYALIRRSLVACLLRWVGTLSGTPPPPGGGFDTVTNEGYAWDEGIKAFLDAVLSSNPSAPGVGLESGVPVPTSTADAPKIGATVAACLYDLYDSQDDDGPGLGTDQYDGALPQIMSVLYRRPVQSLADFWNFWKADGLPRHYPVLALRNNGVDYNTPPVWIVPDVAIVDPGHTIPYRLDLAVSDEETPDNMLVYGASLSGTNPPTDPVSYGVQGYVLSATMNPVNPPGHAHFNVGAFDGIAWSAPGLVRIVWDNPGPKDPDEELDESKTARQEQGSGRLDLALTGTSVIHSSGRFEFTLPVASDVRLSVYDVSGRIVDTIARGFHPAGRHEVIWSAEGVRGRAGMYFLELRAGGQRRAMRTVLVH